ncbi:MAG: PHP domain-containing protein [Candidatus Bathyarchaeia archaeon]
MVLKIDLHVHTCYSSDGITTPREVAAYSKRRGLDGVAITDHDTVDGALRLLRKTDLIIIPGVEITTSGGHILAFNITKSIPSNLRPSETIQRIHEAGGIAAVAHPVTLIRGWRSTDTILNFDAVEVINSSTFPFSLSTHLSRKLAVRLNLPQIAGSDAHYGPEIGFAYTLIDADPEVDEIVQAIKGGVAIPFGRAIPWRLRLKRASLNFKKEV